MSVPRHHIKAFHVDEAEFDKFADEYRALHAGNIRASGEPPEFFARYKVRDVAAALKAEREIPDRPNILDFGAGIGSSVSYFKDEFPSAHLVCVDVSHKSLVIGHRRFQGSADFVRFDGQRLPFAEGSFDIGFVGCVFHHIDHANHAAILEELRRILRLGGHLFVFEHNPLNPLTVRAVRTCPFDANARLIPGPDLKHQVECAGFAGVTLRYRIFFPHALAWLRPLEPCLTKIQLGAQYYVLGRKA